MLDGNVADQFRLVNAAILAQDAPVECRSNSSLHAQDARVEICAVGAISRTRAVPIGAMTVATAVRGDTVRAALAVAVHPSLRMCPVGRRRAIAIPVWGPHAFAPVPRDRPGRQSWRFHWLPILVEIDPGGLEIVEVAAEAEAGACPLECLGIRRCHAIVVVGPLLSGPRVRPKTDDRDSAGDQHLPGDDGLTFLYSGDVVHRLDPVLARPALGSEERVQPIGVGARIGIRYDLPALLIARSVGDAPPDVIWRKWDRELFEELLDIPFRRSCWGMFI